VILAATLIGPGASVALADPQGAVTEYLTIPGSKTNDVMLYRDDTIFASGWAAAVSGTGYVIQLTTPDDSALGVVTNRPVSWPGVTYVLGVAQGPSSGPYANTLLVSSNNASNEFGACSGSTTPRIQAYNVNTWTLVDQWIFPPGICPAQMVLQGDDTVWFQTTTSYKFGRLTLSSDDSKILEPPVSAQGGTGDVALGNNGRVYFAAAADLVSIGTGALGTTLDDSQVINPSLTVLRDLAVDPTTGYVWLAGDLSGPRLSVYSPTAGFVVGQSGPIGTGFTAKSVVLGSDGAMWVATNDRRYASFARNFTPSGTPGSPTSISPTTSFDLATGPTFSGFLAPSPASVAALYRTTLDDSILRIGIAPTTLTATGAQPSAGPAGSKLVITGTMLNTATSVSVGGQPAVIDDSTATSLTVTVPAGTGTVNVVVNSPSASPTLTNAFTYTDQIVLNSDGGTSIDGTDGLRLVANYAGRPSSPLSGGTGGGEQILWSSTSMYFPVGSAGAMVSPSVWIGDDSATGNLYGNRVGYASSCARCLLWDDTAILAYDAVGSDQSATLKYTALYSSTPGDGLDDTYTMTRTLSHSDDSSNFYRETWNFSFEMSSPMDDTETVKFYAGGDTAPGSVDEGFGEEKLDATTGVRSIASLNPSPAVGIQVGYRTLGSSQSGYKDFDGAVAKALSSGWQATVQTGGNIGFGVQQTTHDASMAMQWNIPESGGTYAFETFVSRYRSLTAQAFAPSSIAADDTSVLTLKIDNPQFSPATGLGFRVNLPAQMVLADDSVSTTCTGGVVSGSADDTYLTLSGASVAARDVSTPNTIPSCTITTRVQPLTSGTFTVNAASVASASTELTNIVTPQNLSVSASAPPAPMLDTVTSADGQLGLAWTLRGNGGSSITSVEYSTDSGTTWSLLNNGVSSTATITSTSGTSSPLVNGTTYDVRIRAVNGRGNGTASNMVQGTPTSVTPTPTPTPTPGVPPSAPRDVSAVAGDASAIVSWSVPSDPGSFPVTDYEVAASPGGASCLVKAPQLSCRVSSLTNGTAYTFEVRALNGAGWGAWSTTSAPVTPVGPTPPPAGTIQITGSRGADAELPTVTVNGVTTNLVGVTVQARVRLPGELSYSNGSQRTVRPNGSFTWQRKTKKTVYVYFRTLEGDVRSNRVVISLN
jgi:hypothetical protein